MAVNLYEHQKKAVEMIKPGSILVGGVGTGKSRTALAYYYNKIGLGKAGKTNSEWVRMQIKIPLYIITTARKRDTFEWDEELALFSLSRDKKRSEVEVHIDSWNNIAKYSDVTGAFFIFDEQRLVGTGKWVKTFWKIAKNNKWIVLTATPGDNWLDYAPIFIANGYYKNITEFRAKHVIYRMFTDFPQVERYINVSALEKIRKDIVVPMSFEKKAIRHDEWIKVGYSEEDYDVVLKNRWDIYKGEPLKDASSLCYCLRKVVNSDSRRCQAIYNILQNHPKIIVFYNFDYELELLRSFGDKISVPYSEWNGHKHELILDANTWMYFVQYIAGAEGWNCTQTNTIVFYSQNYSWKAMEQAAGRIDRLDTSFCDLYYYHLFCDSSIDSSITKAIKKKKKFNENNFVKSISKMDDSAGEQLSLFFA